MKKFKIGIFCFGILAVLLAGCEGGTDDIRDITNITSIEIVVSNTSIPSGMSVTFTAVAKLDNNTELDVTSNTKWSSSNEAVLALEVNSSEGVFEGISEGSSTVTALYAGYEESEIINVIEAELVSISLSPSMVNLAKGQKNQLSATGIYTDDSEVDLSSSAQWSSSSSNIVSVSNTGVIEALNEGTSNLSASFSLVQSDVASVEVGEAIVETINVSSPTNEILENETVQFSADGIYTDGTSGDITGTVNWGSSDVNVATINDGGLAEGVSVGDVIISASIGAITGSVDLSIIDTVLVSINITNPASVEEGKNELLEATGIYENNSSRDISTLVTWSSSNTAIATVTGNTVTGVSVGVVSMTASLNGVSESSNISVTPEQWWEHLSVVGGSNVTSSINGFVSAGSWKIFTLVNESLSGTLKVIRIYGEDSSGNLFFDNALNIALAVGSGTGNKITLVSGVHEPKVCYTVQDTSDNVEHSFCGDWLTPFSF